MQRQPLAHFETFFADKPVVFNLMLVPEQDQIAVNVDDVLAVQRNTVSGLVLLADTLSKQPVQDGKMDVHGLELPTVKLHISYSQAILETVELDELAVTERNAEMLAAQVPDAFKLEGIIQIEPFYFAW